MILGSVSMANSSKMMIRFGQLKREIFPPFSPPPLYPSLRKMRASQFQLQSRPIYFPCFFPLHFSSVKHSLTAKAPSIPWWVHDTFISYKQTDTRHFVSHLHEALKRNKITAFIDRNLERGLEIAPAINEAIERSRSAIVVISRTYASSPWCLDELDKILKCKEKKGQLMFIIFVDIDPREMRERSGPFTHIGQSEKGFGQENADKVLRWRDALRKAGNLTGWSLGNRLEADFIQSVVEKISRRLSHLHKNLLVFHPVGLDSQVQALYSLLRLEVGDVRIVGISGPSGIGRSTLVRALYHQIADQFDRSCFLKNVKDTWSQDGLFKMQETLFSDILGDGVSKFGNDIHVVLKTMSTLHNKRVLLVLDDVEGLSGPLSHLLKEINLGLGSRVILIPRHEETLIGLCGEIYKVRALNDDQALELFSWNAFQERYPKSDYKMLSNCFTSFSKGLPLVLTVMGSFLNGKSVKKWQEAFDRLKEIPQGKVREVLKTIINGLEANERMIFLDVACFLNGYDKEEIISSLKQCGVYANSGLEILAKKSLIYIDENNKIWMHDLLQEMGKRMVIQECPENSNNKRSRIWCHEDALEVVKQNLGTDAIEGIKLDKVEAKDLIVNSDSFKKMKKLGLFMMADHVLKCGPTGHLSENLRRHFARNSNSRFACWESLAKQISKFWSQGT